MHIVPGFLLVLLALGGEPSRTPHPELERHLQKARADLEAGAHEDALVAAGVGLEYDPEHVELLERWLSERRGKRVRLVVPSRGVKRKFLEVVRKNGSLVSLARRLPSLRVCWSVTPVFF